jgi:hypothetical protein
MFQVIVAVEPSKPLVSYYPLLASKFGVAAVKVICEGKVISRCRNQNLIYYWNASDLFAVLFALRDIFRYRATAEDCRSRSDAFSAATAPSHWIWRKILVWTSCCFSFKIVRVNELKLDDVLAALLRWIYVVYCPIFLCAQCTIIRRLAERRNTRNPFFEVSVNCEQPTATIGCDASMPCAKMC